MMRLTQPGWRERALLPVLVWLAKRRPSAAKALAEWRAAVAYAHEVDAIEYLQRRGVLSLSEAALLCGRARESSGKSW